MEVGKYMTFDTLKITLLKSKEKNLKIAILSNLMMLWRWYI